VCKILKWGKRKKYMSQTNKEENTIEKRGRKEGRKD
jgi:hypothetical protein